MAGDAEPAEPTPRMEVRPSWWNFARWFLLFFVVLPVLVVFVVWFLPDLLGVDVDFTPYFPVVVGILVLFYVLPPLVAYLKRLALVLRIYDDRLVLERGILSKQTTELFISDVRSIDTRQGVLQRIVRTGDVMIASSGTDEYEYVVEGIPRPGEVKEAIVERRQGGAAGTGDR